MKSISLFCKNATSDKVYHVQVEKQNGGYVVNFSFGRRGNALQRGTKTPRPVDQQTAEAIFDKLVASKMNGPSAYKEMGGASAPAYQGIANEFIPGGKPKNWHEIQQQAVGRTEYPAELLEDLSEQEGEALVANDDYWLQTKFNGKRVQIKRDGRGVTSYNKLGAEIPTHPDVEKAILAVPTRSFFLDGELVDGKYFAFDILRKGQDSLALWNYHARYGILTKVLAGSAGLKVAPVFRTTTAKRNALEALRKQRAEGAVFKLWEAEYKPGRNGQHKKFKFWKSLSAIVLALRPTGKDSISLGLVENGQIINIGNVTTIGKKIPGVGGIVEVKYLYATKDKQLYQTEVIGPRDDVKQQECTTKQLQYQEGV